MHLFSLILGFVVGILFVFLILAISIFIINRRFLKQTLAANKNTNKDISSIVSKKQNKVIRSTRVGLKNNYRLIRDLTKEVVLDIATYYYPDSQNPHLEVTILEALDMNEKVTERLKEVLDTKAFSLFKNVRIAQIIKLIELKKNIENNSVYQFSKKYKLNKVATIGYAALNLMNPGYWVRRIIYTSTLETTLRSIGVMTLNIVAEEATHLYGKKVISKQDILLDQEIQKFITEINMS